MSMLCDRDKLWDWVSRLLEGELERELTPSLLWLPYATPAKVKHHRQTTLKHKKNPFYCFQGMEIKWTWAKYRLRTSPVPFQCSPHTGPTHKGKQNDHLKILKANRVEMLHAASPLSPSFSFSPAAVGTFPWLLCIQVGPIWGLLLRGFSLGLILIVVYSKGITSVCSALCTARCFPRHKEK